MTRQEANFKICDLLINDYKDIALKLKELSIRFPQQRMGQMICNYFECDKKFLNMLFPDNSDPFYEESVVTLKRLINGC